MHNQKHGPHEIGYFAHHFRIFIYMDTVCESETANERDAKYMYSFAIYEWRGSVNFSEEVEETI